MNLFLSVVSRQKATLGEAGLFETDDTRCGTIGSAAGNDWVLPNIDESMAESHAALGFIHDSFYISNTGSAQIFINGSSIAVGKGESEYIRDGDHITLGAYTIAVSLREQTAATPRPEERQNPTSMPAFAPVAESPPPEWREAKGQNLSSDMAQIDAILASGPPSKESMPPPQESETALHPSDLERLVQDLLGPTKSPPETEETAGSARDLAPLGETGPLETSSPRAPIRVPNGDLRAAEGRSVAAEAFWRGLGVAPGWLSAEKEAELFQQLGLTLRAMADGLTDIYAASGESPRGPRPKLAEGGRDTVNPFRRYSSGTDALLAAIGAQDQQRPSIDQAAEACFDDLAARLAAVPDAVSASANQSLANLSPDQVLSDLDAPRRGFFGKDRRSEQLLAELRRRNKDFAGEVQLRFVSAFEKAFAEAYKNHRQWIQRHRNGKA
ncbi:MAG: type VI secretion system-associated FHA domain protein TagH [Pseudomonadota bacterium]